MEAAMDDGSLDVEHAVEALYRFVQSLPPEDQDDLLRALDAVLSKSEPIPANAC